MAYIPTSIQKLTRDTDDGRINNYPSIVVLPSGQKIVFYSKFWTTGKQSYSRITFTSPSFLISIEAGNGVVNGIPVVWAAGNLIASPNTYQIVYVSSTGILGISSSMDMYDTQNVIILAYVSSGFSSITRIEEVEQTGTYIYIRKQVLLGGVWVWDEYEYRLNTGDQPKAFYDASDNKIYVTYEKDSLSYVRMFNPADELTWEYLPNINITSNTITLNRDPQNTIEIGGVGGGYSAIADVYDSDLYPLGAAGFSFINNQTYIFLPFISGSFVQYIKSVITYEVGTLSGSVFTTEETYTIPYYNRQSYVDRYKLWTGTIGVKYIRVRLFTTLVAQEFITSINYYKQVEVYSYPAKVSLEGVNYGVDTQDQMTFHNIASGYVAEITKTAEYVETKHFDTDSIVMHPMSSGYVAEIAKTAEFEETKHFDTDPVIMHPMSSGYVAEITFTSY